MTIETNTIHRNLYPELDLLLWDNVEPTVTGEEAFAIYERKWKYVHKDKLEKKEQALITALTQRYGKGLMLTA